MFQKLRFKERENVALPTGQNDELLTRYGPGDERPDTAAQLTRFSRRHIREGAAQRVRETTTDTPTAPTPSVAGPDLDLYSEQPISIGVLMRALPDRFAEAQAEISDAFDLRDANRKMA